MLEFADVWYWSDVALTGLESNPPSNASMHAIFLGCELFS
jgi:hypothetical protein